MAGDTLFDREEHDADSAADGAAAPRLVLVDGTALAYRGHHALSRQPLLTSKGENVSALFLFAQTLFKILREEKPAAVAVAFDPPGKTFRHRAYPEYKATRDKTPEELVEILPAIRELVEAFRIPIVEVPGYEADDVIATLARRAEKSGWQVYIVTGDKDFLQIVSDRVRLLNLSRPDRGVEIQGPEAAEAKFGVPPDRVVDVLALMGDASDNVPGVSGVGPKTASLLVRRFGRLENLFSRLDEVEKERLRRLLREGEDSARLSKRLVQLDLEAPIELAPEDCAFEGPDREALARLFRRYEMPSLLEHVSIDAKSERHDYVVVRDQASWKRFLKALDSARRFSFDTETTALQPMRADLVGVALSFREREAFYLPLNLDPPLFGSREEDRRRILGRLARAFADDKVKKAAQNAKYDVIVLERAGLEVRGLDFDTMIASYCVSPGERHNLDVLALRYLNLRKTKTSDLIGSGRSQITMDRVDVAKVGAYACEDVDVVERLLPILRAELDRFEVKELFETLEMPLVRVLADMEKTGVAVDIERLRALSEEYAARIEHLLAEIHREAGFEFNPNSPKQLGEVLFERLRIQTGFPGARPRKTKTGWSTEARVLEKFRGHPLVEKLLEYRSLVKLKGTYLDALPDLVHPETGRIHTSYHQAVAATGRLSSSDPNLQNIPIRTEDGRRIREAFVAGRPDGRLLSADYSQVELRILAHLSHDERLQRAFREGVDVHRWTASLLFGMPPDEVPPELRSRAKAINFGVVYGMGPQRLAQETGLSLSDARRFIDAYFETFSGVRRLIDHILKEARRKGFVRTLLGRRREIPDLESSNARVAAQARNVAINTPIQGTAADLIKVAMIRVHDRLARELPEARLILQVHDELVIELPEAAVERGRRIVREEMEGALQLDVPLVVDVGVGSNWLEAH